jgi:phosphonate transport system permease protein
MSTDDSSERGPLARFGFGVTGDTPVEKRLIELKRAKTIRRLLLLVGAIVFGFLFYLALGEVNFTIGEIYRYRGQFIDALGQFFPLAPVVGIPFIDVGAYFEFIQEASLLEQAIVTLAMGFAGTVLGFPGALIMGILGSERVLPFPLNFVFRGIMSTIRAIPALVWALIYIPLGGVSPFTATLAIGTDTMGNLGRLFTDELEEIEEGPIEGIRSTGADKPQTVVFGMLSQVFTPFIAWTLYIFEINTRIAVTMGLIGGGGIGYVLQTQRKLFHYTNMMATILVILLLVISVEMISQRTRAHLRSDTETKSFLTLLKEFPQRMTETLGK